VRGKHKACGCFPAADLSIRWVRQLAAVFFASVWIGLPAARAQDVLAVDAANLINNIRQRLDACGEEGMLADPGVQRVSTTAKRTRPMLVWNTKLAAVAAQHGQAMAEQGFFDHTDPNGRTVGNRVTDIGYRWRVVGENLAAGQQTLGEAMRGWLLSSGHCVNLIDERFTEFGIARVVSGNPSDPYGIYWVLVMGKPKVPDVASR
jgi:Cysteine-rich secretory protein family